VLETRTPHVLPAGLVGEAPTRFRPRSPTVLVVADDGAARRRYASALRGEGYTVHVADASQSAMVLLRDLDPSLTVVDLVPLERMRLVDALMQLDPGSPLFVVNDPEQDIRTAVAVLRRRDEELPPAV
jgi:DNA-binding NtrC family response regulator